MFYKCTEYGTDFDDQLVHNFRTLVRLSTDMLGRDLRLGNKYIACQHTYGKYRGVLTNLEITYFRKKDSWGRAPRWKLLQLYPQQPAGQGVLIECDPSVKAIILKYDEERHDYIVEDLDDDRHLVVKESQLQNLKMRLSRELDEKVMQPEESESE
ncbi:RNA polymerase 2 transcription factor B subunit 5 [Coccidioides immitis RMSCC 3703]|uniref:General transcription and DNA repair factor IIH subunit TFB5 n=1 Tax=Coccidioides immitis RMSCC 3703 TaxID=454286 RepID=A0A0J8QV58_COCIT|nr:RNA polymerase 2 transcription factor B subunit 5 [Coccidioides immitis RMSCC 3703]